MCLTKFYVHVNAFFNILHVFFQVILCAMSSYFEAMFNHDMIETRGGIVTLYDIEPEIFDRLLRFMYTGTIILKLEN